MRKSCLGLIPGAVLSAALGVHTYAASGDAYTWPGYRSDLDYDTKSNLGDIQPPTKFNNNCSGVTGKKAGKWWAFYWGKDRDSRWRATRRWRLRSIRSTVLTRVAPTAIAWRRWMR